MKTIEDFTPEYLEYCRVERGNCLGTIEQKRHSLKKIIDSGNGPPLQVLEINQHVILSLKSRWTKESLSDSRIAFLVSTLRDFLKYLSEFVNLEGVYDYAKITIPRVKGKKKEYWTEQGIDEFIRSLPETTLKDKRYKALCALLAASGARIMEVLGLRRDVNVESREATVLGKGGLFRKVYWDNRAAHFLKLYQDARPVWDRSEFLFGTVNRGDCSGQWNKGDVNRVFRRISKRIGKRIHCHKFRASFLTNCLHKGMNLSAVSKAMGHSDIRTSMRYFAPMTDEDTKAAFEKYYSRSKW